MLVIFERIYKHIHVYDFVLFVALVHAILIPLCTYSAAVP